MLAGFKSSLLVNCEGWAARILSRGLLGMQLPSWLMETQLRHDLWRCGSGMAYGDAAPAWQDANSDMAYGNAAPACLMEMQGPRVVEFQLISPF